MFYILLYIVFYIPEIDQFADEHLGCFHSFVCSGIKTMMKNLVHTSLQFCPIISLSKQLPVTAMLDQRMYLFKTAIYYHILSLSISIKFALPSKGYINAHILTYLSTLVYYKYF